MMNMSITNKPTNISKCGSRSRRKITASRSGARFSGTAGIAESTSNSRSGYWSCSWSESMNTWKGVRGGAVSQADLDTFSSLWEWE